MSHVFRTSLAIKTGLILSAGMLGLAGQPAAAAENLTLRKGISFVSDADCGFPIIASKLQDTAIEPGKAALIFFGASGDLNTNRQAKRIVNLYHRFKARPIKFIIVDIDHPQGKGTRSLIKRLYHGYIPEQILLDAQGKKVWESTGEASEKTVGRQIEKVTASSND